MVKSVLGSATICETATPLCYDLLPWHDARQNVEASWFRFILLLSSCPYLNQYRRFPKRLSNFVAVAQFCAANTTNRLPGLHFLAAVGLVKVQVGAVCYDARGVDLQMRACNGEDGTCTYYRVAFKTLPVTILMCRAYSPK